MICDNYGTHKHPNVKAWLAKHPRFHLHFTPTSSSWLNLVERWFRELTDKAIGCGSSGVTVPMGRARSGRWLMRQALGRVWV
jgi:DDE superfamily endonuclease